MRFVYDETLPIINKSKHLKMEVIQGKKKRKNPGPRRQKNHQGTSSSQTPPVTRSISGLFSFSLLSKNLRSRSKRLILS